MSGFGSGPFGREPFGEWKWSKRVLFEYIPEVYRESDAAQDGLLETFSESLRPSFDELRHQIRDMDTLRDPLTVRTQYSETKTIRLGPRLSALILTLMRKPKSKNRSLLIRLHRKPTLFARVITLLT